jgi:hypothetical protein
LYGYILRGWTSLFAHRVGIFFGFGLDDLGRVQGHGNQDDGKKITLSEALSGYT